MLLHAELVKQDVVLRTHAQVLANTLHLCADVVAINGCGARGGREQSGQDGPETIQSRQSALIFLAVYELDNMHLGDVSCWPSSSSIKLI